MSSAAVPTPATGSNRRISVAGLSSTRVRVSSWQGADGVALVGPGRASILPSPNELERVLDKLVDRGVVRAVTPALSERDARPFEAAGFAIHEKLHLLSADLRPSGRPAAIGFNSNLGATESERWQMRSARRWHERDVIAVDAAAFEPFWRFDAAALRDARRATPRHLYRVITQGRTVQGYAVTGLAGQRGYLQRLAVSPQAQGQGLGQALIFDSFTWLRERQATRVMVNTQERNRRALEVYRSVGFDPEPAGLVVLEWIG